MAVHGTVMSAFDTPVLVYILCINYTFISNTNSNNVILMTSLVKTVLFPLN